MRVNAIIGLSAGAALALLLAACATTVPAPNRGKALYEGYCAACHGPGGKGDGVLAGDWKTPPADLTGIAARNGGPFPLAQVLSQIDGYTRRNDRHSAMPEMGQVFQDSPTVLVDTGDGIETPVPEALLALADYLRELQE
ncbi:cytochrome c [Frigidibacter sp. RF13]|uniref:c-type cytochrome n=1 Tax=Frigidibacter sp. RF13 TaxID=2997340 RepID=UPI00226F20E8|nr:cytochrome c [Frigidibacter sp. RF13]MCY1128505.1 cytochrome c [Frigidibacter sp. RF13]